MKESIHNIGDTRIIFIDHELSKGEIIISDPKYGYFNYYWGAMGKDSDLSDFIKRINNDYFANCLLREKSLFCFDVKKTFTSLRKFIREELNLPWYKHQNFQKNLRDCINRFQSLCELYKSETIFIDSFRLYMYLFPDFVLIKDRFDSECAMKDFEEMCSEPWYFIEKKEHETTKWLKNIHTKLQKKIKQ